MKIIKTANGKKTIKISKKEWQAIGKKAGWEGNPEIEQTGEWAGKTISELKKSLSNYKKKQESYKEKHDGKANAEYTEKMREINFAIRSKKKGKGKWGEV